jgi:HlyD family secretion protein
VYLPDEKRLIERGVRVGVANWDQTEILDGLAEGEQVVTSVDREGVGGGAYARPDTDKAK